MRVAYQLLRFSSVCNPDGETVLLDTPHDCGLFVYEESARALARMQAQCPFHERTVGMVVGKWFIDIYSEAPGWTRWLVVERAVDETGPDGL